MTQPQFIAATSPSFVPADTRLGAVRLAVTDAPRALAVWRDLLGLALLGEEEGAIP